MENSTIDYLIVFIAGVSLGVFTIGFALENVNSDFESAISHRYKSGVEICESVGSIPVAMDLDDELVCANGATFDYREYMGGAK